jgi:uncharacterized protein YndB with AHSA1/START domain
MTKKNKSNEIKLTRIYDAPVKAVWDAWTDPKQAAKWWGPRGFTITTHSKELKPGGGWHYTMHGPDGVDYPNKTKYFEVEKYSRLVYDHGGNDEQKPLFRVTVSFSENKGKTKMEMTMTLPTPEAAAETEKFIKKAGGNSTWDRLAEYLEKESTGKEKFVINRTFDTDNETMFDMWTDPKHVVNWTGPAGATMEYIKADIKTGGSSFYCMPFNGTKMYGKVQYVEVKRPDRLVYFQQFADENGNTTRHPMAPTWPENMMTTVTFFSEGPDKTRVHLEWEVHGKASKEEMDTFIQSRAGMAQGWGGSFDKLEEYLEKA